MKENIENLLKECLEEMKGISESLLHRCQVVLHPNRVFFFFTDFGIVSLGRQFHLLHLSKAIGVNIDETIWELYRFPGKIRNETECSNWTM